MSDVHAARATGWYYLDTRAAHATGVLASEAFLTLSVGATQGHVSVPASAFLGPSGFFLFSLSSIFPAVCSPPSRSSSHHQFSPPRLGVGVGLASLLASASKPAFVWAALAPMVAGSTAAVMLLGVSIVVVRASLAPMVAGSTAAVVLLGVTIVVVRVALAPTAAGTPAAVVLLGVAIVVAVAPTAWALAPTAAIALTAASALVCGGRTIRHIVVGLVVLVVET